MNKRQSITASSFPSSPAQSQTRRPDDERLLGQWQVNLFYDRSRLTSGTLTTSQIHSGNIVTSELLKTVSVQADGILLPAVDNATVGVTTADCAPVIIITDHFALALHISRKSIVSGLMDNVLSYIDPKQINWVYIGPHICEYHFSFVDEDHLVRRFRSRFTQAAHFHQGLMYLSLTKAITYFLDNWQVHPHKIIQDGRCTYEIFDLPSYRRWQESGRLGQLNSLMTTVKRK